VVGALYRYQKTLEASLVTPADIALRDIMATRENSISDSSQVDLNIFCPDVDQHDLETANSRIEHHLQIVLSSERGLNGEALTLAMFLPAEIRTCRAAVTADAPGMLGWRALLIASGSRSGVL
jgi:hypothetical protein